MSPGFKRCDLSNWLNNLAPEQPVLVLQGAGTTLPNNDQLLPLGVSRTINLVRSSPCEHPAVVGPPPGPCPEPLVKPDGTAPIEVRGTMLGEGPSLSPSLRPAHMGCRSTIRDRGKLF